MLKKIILFLFLTMPVFAQEEVLQAQIKYNEASAKIEAFKDIEKKISKEQFKDFLKDKNKKENLNAIRGEIYKIENRYLSPFYIKENLVAYAITYNNIEDKIFYYNILGNLIRFDVIVNINSYPRKTIGYSRYGNLLNVAFEVDKNEQFVYDEHSKLIAHWKDDKTQKTKYKFLKITRKFD